MEGYFYRVLACFDDILYIPSISAVDILYVCNEFIVDVYVCQGVKHIAVELDVLVAQKLFIDFKFSEIIPIAATHPLHEFFVQSDKRIVYYPCVFQVGKNVAGYVAGVDFVVAEHLK